MTDGEAVSSTKVRKSPSLPDAQPSAPVRLFESLASELRRFLLGVTHDPNLADDLLQATFLKAVEQGQEVDPEKARGWLFQVAYREVLQVRRRSAVQDRAQRRLATLEESGSVEPDASLIREETVRSVREALDQLKPEQKTVVLARIREDKTFAEIAQELNLPLGTVLTRMRRGLEIMRRYLNPGD